WKLSTLGQDTVPLDWLHVDVPDISEETRGAGPEAEVLLGAPVDLIVVRSSPGAGVVGDLVVLVAGLAGQGNQTPVLRPEFVARPGCLVAGGVPEAPLVQSQRVGGEVIGPPADDAAHRRVPGRRVETRKTVDQVRADVVESRRARRIERVARVLCRVLAVERGKDPVVETL